LERRCLSWYLERRCFIGRYTWRYHWSNAIRTHWWSFMVRENVYLPSRSENTVPSSSDAPSPCESYCEDSTDCNLSNKMLRPVVCYWKCIKSKWVSIRTLNSLPLKPQRFDLV
jgi:hypothetical protein